jgi:hypothetical protein
MNQAFNIIISSKNRAADETNSSIIVKMKEDFYVADDEELYVCMSTFTMIKSFYAAQSGLNDHFQVIFRLPGENIPIEVFDRYLSEGNYDVNSLRNEIKKLNNNALFDITYEPRLNKYLFKNLFQPTFEVYIKPITAGVFFGFENNTEYLITAEGTYSSKFINVSGYTTMILKIDGDISIDNTISNVTTSDYTYDKILGVLSISDVPPMDSITYKDDGSCIFKHKINNKKIPSFNIKVVNEAGQQFPQMADWIMMLKFDKVKKTNPEISSLNQILYDIRFYIMSFYAYFQIPSRITFQDLVDSGL